MSETKIQVPEGMLKAAAVPGVNGLLIDDTPIAIRVKDIERILEAALSWLSENPTSPTGRQIQEMSDNLTARSAYHSVEDFCREWQRCMFLMPEPEVPEAIKDLVPELDKVRMAYDLKPVQDLMIEAYHRGTRGTRVNER